MNKSIIILFVAFALLQLVRSEEEKPADAESSNPISDALKQGTEAGKAAGDKLKDGAEKTFGQVRDGLVNLKPNIPKPSGGDEAPKEK